MIVLFIFIFFCIFNKELATNVYNRIRFELSIFFHYQCISYYDVNFYLMKIIDWTEPLQAFSYKMLSILRVPCILTELDYDPG